MKWNTAECVHQVLGILKSSTNVWFPIFLIISDLHCQAEEISKVTDYAPNFLIPDPSITESLSFYMSKPITQSWVSICQGRMAWFFLPRSLWNCLHWDVHKIQYLVIKISVWCSLIKWEFIEIYAELMLVFLLCWPE